MHSLNKSLLLFALSLVMMCCKPVEETPDTAVPEITIVTPTANSRVKGTISIAVKIEDQSRDVSIQIFVDNNLLKRETGKEATAAVDTKSLTEGIHEIKVVATDKAENSSTKIISIEVRNVLFKLAIPSNYVSDGAIVYQTLSKNDGTIMTTYKVENGASISFNTPEDFNPDSTFVFTEFFYLSIPNYLFRGVNSYAGIKAGEFSLPRFDVRTIIGNHQIEISDMPTNSQQVGRLDGGSVSALYGSFGAGSLLTQDLQMLSTTSDLLCIFPNSENIPLYKFVNTIQSGGSTKISWNDFTAMTKADIALNTPESYSVIVRGINTGMVKREGVEVYNFSGSASNSLLSLFYPGNNYSTYSFDISVGAYSNFILSATPPTTIKNLSAEVKSMSYLNRKLKVNTSGDFDFITLSGGTSNYDAAQNLVVSNFNSTSFPAGAKQSVTLPQVPLELSSYNFVPTQQHTFYNAKMTDYLSLSGQEDYQSKIVFSVNGKFRQELESYSKTVGVASSARSSSQEMPKDLAAIVKRYFPFGNF